MLYRAKFESSVAFVFSSAKGLLDRNSWGTGGLITVSFAELKIANFPYEDDVQNH
jgi:hypothetical protein